MHNIYRKLEVLDKTSLRCHCGSKENGNITDQTATREKLQSSQEEINNLKNSLYLKNSLEVLSEEHSRLLGQNKKLEAEITNLKEGLASDKQQFREKLSQRDAKIVNCKQEFSDASEKLLQEKSTNTMVTAKMQEMIESIRVKQVSDEKLLVEIKFKQLEEENLGSENEDYSKPASFEEIEKFDFDSSTLHSILPECCVIKSDMQIAYILYANEGSCATLNDGDMLMAFFVLNRAGIG
ncbi:hypothetical protein ABZP36_000804 [Zizania latifolia]